MKEKLVLVGNGMAGVRTLEELLKLNPDAYDITVFGAEPYGNYNRIMLSPMLTGDTNLDAIMLNRPEWYAENNIKLHTGIKIVKIDRKNRVVVADDGSETVYDRLLLATGSNPFILPVPGHTLEGVIGFRDVHDVEVMLDAAKKYKHAVVIGGGLLGLEAANGLQKNGMKVRVVHLSDTLMNQQLDTDAGKMLQQELEERGVEFLMGASTKELIGRKRVQGVMFADGREVSADLVVMAVGIRPDIKLAESAGIYCNRGIVVNDTMQTYDPRVYAVGECVQHRNQTYGLVAPLFEMAKVCANHLAKLGYGQYTGSVTSTKLKVTGIDLFSAGDFNGDDDCERIIYRDASKNIYKKVVLKDNRIQGALLYGNTMDGPWYFQLMREQSDVSAFRDALMFGQGHLGDSGHDNNSVMNMSDDAEVCGCNGVTKGDIVKAITSEGLFTLDEVKAHTKASASCGGCAGLVEQILASTVGSDFSHPVIKPMCGCTDHSHDQVRAAIREQVLTSIDAVYKKLEWRNENGCPSCRPAINYYLLSSWPEQSQDDSQSRFINERVHANIQKDRSYTVVPRMWGGVTTPAELRAIADAAEKYDVPMVKLTGGQRIDLVGVQKEQLPHIWKDLNSAGMVSGHAYGKALRTVKTCIGSQYCRFGTQDSVAMGIALEKLSWASWTPHKFKMAVSGCPRNCAEATIKDFGVVAVDSGYELHIGGNGGIKVRVTDLLARVETDGEVLEYAGAFMQLYREEARYLERTAPWIERVGLNYVKERIVNDVQNRMELNERFLLSQKIAQNDPWAELSKDEHRLEFVPMKSFATEISEEKVVVNA
jgi:nitrite reductase (NADH) large subunit